MTEFSEQSKVNNDLAHIAGNRNSNPLLRGKYKC